MKGYTRHQSHEGRGHVSIFPIWWILMFQECWVWMQSFPRKHNTVLIVVTFNQIIISYQFTFIPNGKGFCTRYLILFIWFKVAPLFLTTRDIIEQDVPSPIQMSSFWHSWGYCHPQPGFYNSTNIASVVIIMHWHLYKFWAAISC